MMDILMYLFETYIHSEVEFKVDQKELSGELKRAGFNQNDINKALKWLEKLADLQNFDVNSYEDLNNSSSFRVYTDEERNRLNSNCLGFLLFLEQTSVLTPDVREMVLDRVMALEVESFSLDDLKWLILMVLFNLPGKEKAYQQMEELLYEIEEGYIH